MSKEDATEDSTGIQLTATATEEDSTPAVFSQLPSDHLSSKGIDKFSPTITYLYVATYIRTYLHNT